MVCNMKNTTLLLALRVSVVFATNMFADASESQSEKHPSELAEFQKTTVDLWVISSLNNSFYFWIPFKWKDTGNNAVSLWPVIGANLSILGHYPGLFVCPHLIPSR